MSCKKHKKKNTLKESESLCLKCDDTYIFDLTQTTYFGVNKTNQFSSLCLCRNCPIEIIDYTSNLQLLTVDQIISILEKERNKDYPEEIIYFQRTDKNLDQFVCAQSFIYSQNLVDYFGKKKELSSWIILYGGHYCIGHSNLDLQKSIEKIMTFFKDVICNNNEQELEEQQKIIKEFKESHHCYCSFTVDELKYKLKDIINLNYIEIDDLNPKSIIKVINNNKISNKLFLRTKENEEKFKILQNYIETIFPMVITQTNDDGNQNERNDLKPLYGWIMQINQEQYLLGLPNKDLKNVKTYVKNFIDKLKLYQLH